MATLFVLWLRIAGLLWGLSLSLGFEGGVLGNFAGLPVNILQMATQVAALRELLVTDLADEGPCCSMLTEMVT